MILWDPTNPHAAYYHHRAAVARAQAVDAGIVWLAAAAVRTGRRLWRAAGQRRRRAGGGRIPAGPRRVIAAR